MPLTTSASPAFSTDFPPRSRAAASVARQELAARTAAQLQTARDADSSTRQALFDEVVTAHLWLADSVARKYFSRREDADDLRQIARAGLVEACIRFDPDHGQFVPFAFATMSGLVKRHFRDHGWSIRPPRQAQELSTELWRRWPELAQSLGSEPTDQQLADLVGSSPDEVRRARRATQVYSASSLEDLTHEVADEDDDREQSEARVLISAVWPDLTEAEQNLIRMRFVEELSQVDIATILGTNQMQVSRYLARLMLKLRGLVGALDDTPRASSRAA